MNPSVKDKFKGCIIGGAIGDAWGSSYENLPVKDPENVFYLNEKFKPQPSDIWQLTDDTILTIATCEVLKSQHCTPEILAAKFVEYFKRKEIIGLGSSTLKALLELEAGGHWTQVGRKGEYGAGNGSAMRIAAFSFYDGYEREDIRNFSRITHHNEEAYAGALAIYFAIRYTIMEKWNNAEEFLGMIVKELPDTNVRDRLIEIKQNQINKSIREVAELGNNGYVVNSIPFAIFSSTKILNDQFENILSEVIKCGGDTDTNSSLAGQIMGTKIGYANLPIHLIQKLESVNYYAKLRSIIMDHE